MFSIFCQVLQATQASILMARRIRKPAHIVIAGDKFGAARC